jgi:hypothetical protein
VRMGGAVRYHLPTIRDALLAHAEGGRPGGDKPALSGARS